GLVQIAPDGRILVANRALLRMLGRDSTEAIRDTRMVDLIATREGQTALEEALRGRPQRAAAAPAAPRPQCSPDGVNRHARRAGQLGHNRALRRHDRRGVQGKRCSPDDRYVRIYPLKETDSTCVVSRLR